MKTAIAFGDDDNSLLRIKAAIEQLQLRVCEFSDIIQDARFLLLQSADTDPVSAELWRDYYARWHSDHEL